MRKKQRQEGRSKDFGDSHYLRDYLLRKIKEITFTVQTVIPSAVEFSEEYESKFG